MSKRKQQRHCFVPGCRSGYNSNKSDKASLFKAPTNNRELLAKWTINIRRADRPLDDRAVVCEKHFDEKFISREYVHIVKGEEVRIPRFRPALSKDAIPTIFPSYPKCPSSKPTKINTRKRAVKRATLKRKENNSALSIGAFTKKRLKGSDIQTVTDTGVCADEYTNSQVDGTYSGQLDKMNFPSKDCPTQSLFDMGELQGKEAQTRNTSSNLPGVTEKEKTLLKTVSGPLLFDARKRRDKGTQTKISSFVVANQAKENKRLRSQLMKQYKENESLKERLKEKSDKLECFENNVLFKSVAKMQAIYNEGLASNQIEFTLNQISNFEKKSPRWSNTVLRECVLLRAASSKCYDAFKNGELVMLPSKRTLENFAKSINNQDKAIDDNCEVDIEIVKENLDSVNTSGVEKTLMDF